MFLSGYGLVKSFHSNGLNSFWDKKIKKIFIPAVLINAFSAVITQTFGGIKLSREQIVEGIFMITRYNRVNGPAWYVTFIMCYYLIFYMIYSVPCNEEYKLFLFFCVNFLMWYIIPAAYPAANGYAFSSFIGMLFGRYDSKCRLNNEFAAFIGVSSFVILVRLFSDSLENISFRLSNITENILFVLCTIGMVCLLKMVNNVEVRFKKWLLYLGKRSFFIYLLHWAILMMPLKYGVGNLWIIVACIIMIIASDQIDKFLNKKVKQ